MEIESTSTAPEQSTAPVETAPEATPDVQPDAPTFGSPEPTTPPEPVYQPNLKYKVLDKELEFDPELKDVVKSKAIEEKIRDLYTKASGLDPIKQDREKIRGEYQKTKGEFETVMKGLQTLNHFYNQGDLKNFFGQLKIDDDTVLKYAIDLAKAKELPPEHQQQYNQTAQLAAQNYFLQQQMQEFQQSQAQQQEAQVRAEYDQAISQPEVNSFVSQFEAKNGRGSFMQEVRMRGEAFYRQHQYDAPPQQIVGEILSRFNMSMPQQQPQQAQMPQQQTVAHHQQHVPVIPVAKSSGSSVVSKKPRNLREYKAELEALQNS